MTSRRFEGQDEIEAIDRRILDLQRLVRDMQAKARREVDEVANAINACYRERQQLIRRLEVPAGI
jgi:predicted  nucleic acid-binding Zn-ribbon protein